VLRFSIKEYNKKFLYATQKYDSEYKPNLGSRISIIKDINEVFLAVPDDNTEDYGFTLVKDTIVEVTKNKHIIAPNENYTQVATYDLILGDKKEHQKGWIETDSDFLDEKKRFSFNDWGKFGFKTFNAGDEYIYDIKDLRENERTESNFVKELWKTLGYTLNEEELDLFELDAAYSILETQQDLSRMVCNHKSEWSYTPEQIVNEVTKIYDYSIKKAPKKAKENLKKIKEEVLKGLKGQIEKLMFWKDLPEEYVITTSETEPSEETENQPVSMLPAGTQLEPSIAETQSENAATTTQLENSTTITQTEPSVTATESENSAIATQPENSTTAVQPEPSVTASNTGNEIEEPIRTLPPKDGNVYHFHPIAFINHMRLIYGEGGGDCQSIIWGNRVSCQFRAKVIKIAENLWGSDKKIKMANNLMAVFAWESGGTFKPDAPNQANSGATGLIQFMPETAAGLLGKNESDITIETVYNYWGKYKHRKRVKEFADMSDLEQLDYVEKYFQSLKGKDVEFVDFYLQVLFPASSGKPEHVVFSKTGSGLDKSDPHYDKRISSYGQNSGMDSDKNGEILKSEIEKDVSKYLKDGEKHRNICTGDACTLNKKVKEGFDIDAAVSHLNKKAHPKSIHRCALYVREAIDAGGLLGLSGDAEAYYNTDRLVQKGFTMIGTNKETITFKKGDIVAFKEQIGHKWGHIAMYNGSQWVSDFKQNGFFVSTTYKAKKEYKIFRWE